MAMPVPRAAPAKKEATIVELDILFSSDMTAPPFLVLLVSSIAKKNGAKISDHYGSTTGRFSCKL